jgi:phage anti-repressor protein
MNFAITNLNTDPTLFGNIDVEVVLARQVHEQLQSQADYSTWFRERIGQAFLVKGEDYWEFSHIKPTSANIGATKVIEHFVTLDTAKHLAMLERTETGRKVRAYFIERDKQLRQLLLTPPAQQVEPDPAVLAESAFLALQDEMEKTTEEKEALLAQVSAVDARIQGLLQKLTAYEGMIARVRLASTPAGLHHLQRSRPIPLPPGTDHEKIREIRESRGRPPVPKMTSH